MIKAFNPNTVVSDLKSLTQFQTTFLSVMIVTMLSLSYFWGDNLISVVSGISGVMCVFLVNMRKLSNYFWGVLNCSLYGYVAFTASYYGDTMLNWMFYLPIQFIGAYFWAKNMDSDTTIVRSINSIKTLTLIVVMSLVTISIYSVLLSKLGGNLTFVDATTTTLSILATYLMVKGYREQWVCWITVNTTSIYMWIVNYMQNGDNFSVLIMWVMFLVNSIYGCYTWFKSTSKE